MQFMREPHCTSDVSMTYVTYLIINYKFERYYNGTKRCYSISYLLHMIHLLRSIKPHKQVESDLWLYEPFHDDHTEKSSRTASIKFEKTAESNQSNFVDMEI